MEYKKTLNLPKTDFPIKSNPKKVEEDALSFWESEGVYGKMVKKGGARKFILHDGPPYANGDIHLGHAINKVLKDIVVKSRAMSGFSVPFIPGWDCHGLPIETQLIKKLGVKRKEMEITEFRKLCRDYAMKYVDVQRKEFIRLGCFGEWEKPYLTLDPSYESRIAAIFGKLAESGYVLRGLKPMHWCPSCETALAEAEIEYQEKESHSIYVKFRIKSIKAESAAFKPMADSLSSGTAHIVIWTTTPWTLPANVAIAVNPGFEYAAVRDGDDIYVVAEGLLEDFVKKSGLTEHPVLTRFKGEALEGVICAHPFVQRDVLVVLNDQFVTLEQGTGAVHIAPGHGEEDYRVGLEYKLPTVMPVDPRGFFTSEAGKYSGLRYDKANEIILSDMKEDGSLLYSGKTRHSYPHCWRCKKPVIFRATEQWFVSVDHKNMRTECLKAIASTKWLPPWGENRIRGMMESRPDWCISRQRSWGVPIPAFFCRECGKPAMTGEFNKAIVKLFSEEGTDGWFRKDAAEILGSGFKCPECGSAKFKKETDILDVWFESGASHFAVLEGSKELKWPADLYLEGSDQHRGWFQTSLLTSVGAKGRAPYDAVLTHGFTVDESGKKMSKSLGNVVDPQKVVSKYGADVLRLWVASTDFRDDMSASENILKQVNDAYGKIRNTCRFLISNLGDFDPKKDRVPQKDMKEPDRWAVLKFSRLAERVRKAYDNYEFHIAFHSIRDFCVNDLSAFYLDISKDTLYCDAPLSASGLSARTALFEILKGLVVLFAPILSFTAEDIWKRVPGSGGSVFLEGLPMPAADSKDKALESRWDSLMKAREEVYRVIEIMRNNKELAGAIESDITLYAKGAMLEALKGADDLSRVFICSRASAKTLDEAPEGSAASAAGDLKFVVKKSSWAKCERCWNYRETVGSVSKHKTLCKRCADTVESLEK